MTSIMNSPNWSSTAVFITYDDCGCFYDQGIPRRNPDGTWQGPRSPLVIVSPYARPGYTDTTHTTFAGLLAFVEHNFGLTPLGPNDRDAYDFSNTFNYRQAPRRPVRMVIRPLPPSAKRIRITRAMLDDPNLTSQRSPPLRTGSAPAVKLLPVAPVPPRPRAGGVAVLPVS